MRKITHIVLHCTATPEGREVSASTIDAWHRNRRFEPYVDPATGHRVYAGYHYLVHLDGSVERLRPEGARGQHCPQGNMNNVGLSVCYVGGVGSDMHPKDTRTPQQRTALLRLLREIKSRWPQAGIIGHRDVRGVAKACPCFDAAKEYAAL